MQAKVNGKVVDLPLDSINNSNYIVPKGEEDYYHCKIETKYFDPQTGKKLSRPEIQVFERKMFEGFGYHCLKQQGYAIEILHDAKQWEEVHKAEMEAQARKEAEKAAKAAEAAKKAEREALKAELMAELKKDFNITPKEDVKAEEPKKAKK